MIKWIIFVFLQNKTGNQESMAKTEYPKFRSFFHQEENTDTVVINCSQCGNQINEYSNCVCPHCNADIRNEMDQQCTTWIQQLIAGWLETKHEYENKLLSKKEFGTRVSELENFADTIVACGEELKSSAEREYEPFESQREKLNNNFLFKVVDFICQLFNGGIEVAIILGLLFFSMFFIFKGIIGVVFTLLGVVFFAVSIIAMVWDKKSKIPYDYILWRTAKAEAYQTLKVFFSNKLYTNQELTSHIMAMCDGMKDDINVAKESGDQYELAERKKWWAYIYDLVGWLWDMDSLIGFDYLKKIGQIVDEKDLPGETRQTLKNRKEHWNEFHKKYEV